MQESRCEARERMKSIGVQLSFLGIVFLLLLGSILIYTENSFSGVYWTVLLVSAVFFPKTWILKCWKFILESWGEPIKENLKNFKYVLLATIVFTIMAHGFLFSNEFFSHDSVTFMRNMQYIEGGLHYYTSAGRFLIPLYEVLKGIMTAPWVVGILFFLWITLTNFLITCILKIKTVSGAVLISGLVCSDFVLALTGATYIYCMDEYSFALLLSVVAAYLFCRCRHSIVLGISCVVAALAIYQPYFTVTLVLCFLATIQSLLENEKAAKAISNGLKYVALLAISFLVYLLCWTVISNFLGVEKVRLSESLLGGGLSQLYSLVLRGIIGYVNFFASEAGAFGVLRPVANVLLLGLFCIKLVYYFLNVNNRTENKILVALLLCFTPLVFNAISILLTGDVSQLAQFSYDMIYLMFIFSMEMGEMACISYRRYKIIISGLLCCIIWQNVVFDNQLYIKKELEKTATISVVTRIIDRIESIDGYVPGQTPVAFVGSLSENQYLNSGRIGTESLLDLAGMWYDYSATYNLPFYITTYLNYPLLQIDSAQISQLEEVQNMPAFPYEGAVQWIEDVVVVKVS